MRNLVGRLLLFVLVAVACAGESSSIVTFTNPRAAGTQFRKIAVFVDRSDLASRAFLERRVEYWLRQSGVEVVAGSGILFPGERYNAEGAHDALVAQGVDGIFILRESGSNFAVPQLGALVVSEETAVAPAAASAAPPPAEVGRRARHVSRAPVKVTFNAVLLSVGDGKQTWLAEVSANLTPERDIQAWTDVLDQASFALSKSSLLSPRTKRE